MPASPPTRPRRWLREQVKIAKAGLVPTDANLLPAYESFAKLKAACDAFCEEMNAREHRETRRQPVELLAEERRRLHPLPDEPYTVAFGVTRVVDDEATIRYGSPVTRCLTSSPGSESGSGSRATSSSSPRLVSSAPAKWPDIG